MLRQTEPGLVAFYDIRIGNGAGLFLQLWSPQRCTSYTKFTPHTHCSELQQCSLCNWQLDTLSYLILTTVTL